MAAWQCKNTYQAEFFNINLVSANGDVWRRHRNVCNPVFELRRIRQFASLFARKSDELLLEFEKVLGQPLEIQHYMERFTMDCLGVTCFDVDFRGVQDANSVYPNTYRRILKAFGDPLRFGVPFGLYEWLPIKANRQLRADINRFNELMFLVLERRKQQTAKQGEDVPRLDLASQLLDASVNEESLTREEVRGNMAIFFLAGHDTTATSLSSVLFHLALHPEFQQKAFEEAKELGTEHNFTDFDPNKSLDYLTAVIQEATRLAPPVTALHRAATEDVTLGGHVFPKGTIFQLRMQENQWLEREWPNAKKFNPARFLAPENGGDNSTSLARRLVAWQVFGGGQRMCIGRNFSIMEQKILLSKFLVKYEVSLPKGHPGQIALLEAAGLNKVKNEIIIQLRK